MRRRAPILHLALALALAVTPACRERPREERSAPSPQQAPAPAAPGEADAGAPSASELIARVDALKERIKDRPKTLEILVTLGDLYYQNGRPEDAVDWYRQAIAFAAPDLERLDALPRAARTAAPSPKAVAACGSERGERRTHEALSSQAQAFERARAAADAAYCWRAALAPALDAQARRGGALLLLGNADEALADEAAVLAREPSHADALFFEGVALAGTARGDREKLSRARDDWRRMAEAHPDDPRAERARQGAARLDAILASAGGAPQAGSGPASAPAAPGGRAPAQAATAGGKPQPSAGSAAPVEPAGPGEARSGGGAAAGSAPAAGPASWSDAEREVGVGEALLAAGDVAGARQHLAPLVAPVMLRDREAPPRLAARVLAAMGYVEAAAGQRDRAEPMLRIALDRDPANDAAKRAVAALDAKQPLPAFAAPAAPR
jgi:tetratricopeptide (TPR) repeat protein